VQVIMPRTACLRLNYFLDTNNKRQVATGSFLISAVILRMDIIFSSTGSTCPQ
jgi:hypothetical protein